MNLIAGLAGALCAAVLAVLGLTWYSHGLSTRVAQQASALEAVQQANKDNLGTITELRSTNAGWAAKCSVEPGAGAAAVDAVETVKENEQKRQADDRSVRKTIYAGDTHAKDWANQPIPPAVVARLRDAESAGSD